MITCQDYRVADPDALETPAMLLFRHVMDHNIRAVCDMVGGGQNLIAHVKTHKSEAVARKQIEVGIAGFKCAPLQVNSLSRASEKPFSCRRFVLNRTGPSSK